MNDNSFFSIDRLVEFGMGMAMVQQMVQMMNQTMQQMQVPGSQMPAPQSATIYVALGGQPVGPLAWSDFSRLVTEKKVTKDTLAWMPGMLGWKPIEQVPAILKIVAVTPPPIPVK